MLRLYDENNKDTMNEHLPLTTAAIPLASENSGAVAVSVGVV